MIREDMSLADLKRETLQDDLWFAQREKGWRKKYAKLLKKSKIPNGTILGISHYTTPNGNSVYVVIKKCYYGKDGKYAALGRCCLYEYEGNNGGKKYLQCLGSSDCASLTQGYDFFIVYTEHCIQRLMERGNITMLDAFKEMGNGL